jgi:hypothetical protein
MGVGAAPPARGSAHTPISAGETAGRVPGPPRSDAEPSDANRANPRRRHGLGDERTATMENYDSTTMPRHHTMENYY